VPKRPYSRRLRLRRPVLSRLTWAWLGAAVIGAFLVAGLVAAALNPNGAGRIALPISELEHTVRTSAADGRLSAHWESAPAGQPRGPGAPSLRGGLDASEQERSEQETRSGQEERRTAQAGAPAGAPDAALPAVNGETFAAALAEPRLSPEDIVITIDGQAVDAEGRAAAVAPTAARIAAADRPAPIPEPDPAMLRSTPLGKVPRVAGDGRRPMEYYARQTAATGVGDGRPRVAVIVGGLGLDPALTEKAIDLLPADVSLAFAPYAKDLEFWTAKARRDGHEILIELPMESYGGDQRALGPAALLSSRSPSENLQRLDWLMSRFGGYFAATNYLGGRFSADADALAPVLEQLRDAGVAYIDDTGAAARAASRSGARAAAVDRTIPPVAAADGVAVIKRELAALEAAARRNGAALAKTYAAPATIEEIARWSARLEAEGLAAAPASYALRAQAASR